MHPSLCYLSTDLITVTTLAQILNPGFEFWSGGTPAGWLTDNHDTLILGTHSSDAHGGTSAAQRVVRHIGFGIYFYRLEAIDHNPAGAAS